MPVDLRPTARRAAAAGLLLALAACADAPADPAEREARARIRELVEALQPIEETVTSDVTDAHFHRQVALLDALRKADRAVGLEALRYLREEGSGGVEAVERGLIDVAAHAAPAVTEPLLVSLVTQYGASLNLRTEAVVLLGATAPETAIEVLGPLLKQRQVRATLPPTEFLVRSYASACDAEGVSPVPVLAFVATNVLQEDSARHAAVRALGEHPEPLALKALQSILVESTGNAYMRRLAAQGLRDALPAEEACRLFQQVGEREADLNFAQFLASLLLDLCP